MNAVTKTPPTSFGEAFLKMQTEIRPAIKDSNNPAFRSKYADLNAVWDAIREPLHNNGFFVVQAMDFDGEHTWLSTVIQHTSGESRSCRFPLRPTKPDMQGLGSAISYARRYSISAMLGVIADDDDDGNAASGVSTNGNGKSPAPAPSPPQPKNDQDILAGMRNWVDQQKDIIIELSDMDQMEGWLKKNASYGGREGNWDRPTPSSLLDKILKNDPKLFNELKKYYLEKLVEI